MSAEFGAVSLRWHGAVCVLTQHHGVEFRNELDADFLESVERALDAVERSSAKALVTTADGKFWNNGINLQWLSAQPAATRDAFLASMHRLLRRMLVFPVPTVAAINGHAFAGGFMLAMAHDYRIMRTERGWLCLSAILNRIVLPQALLEVVRIKTTPNAFRDAVLTGRRHTAEEALAAGLVDRVVPAEQLLSAAIELAERLAQADSATYGAMKAKMYASAAELLATTTEFDAFPSASL